MKKVKVVCIAAMCACILSALCLCGCTYEDSEFFKGVTANTYVVWEDEAMGISLRQVRGNGGYGYVTIDGVKYSGAWYVSDLPEWGDNKGDYLSLSFESEDFETADNLLIYPDNSYVHCAELYVTADNKSDPQSLYYAADDETYSGVSSCGIDYRGINLVKKELSDRSDIDAKEYVGGIVWLGDCLTLDDISTVSAKHLQIAGTAKTADGDAQIIFRWLNDNRFEIEQYVGTDILAYGTYTNVETEAVLYFEYDELFNLEYAEMPIHGELV